MANMSYCAFENTANDLADCLTMLYDARKEGASLAEFKRTRSSKHEARAVERLIAAARELLDVADDQVSEED